MTPSAARLLCATFLVTSSWPALGVTTEEELAFAYGGQEFVSLATGSRQSIARAPATATVITAADIKAMGATDLDEALETVPGLHVSRSAQGYNPIYTIRGIRSEFNPEVLLLVNGIPLTNLFAGNRGQAWGGMPVANIARVEVIRGPGSALYGAEAFAGVINVITKTASDIAGGEVGIRTGSRERREAWALYGGRWGDFEVAGALEVGRLGSSGRIVEADAQSFLDALFGTRASLAPGPVSTQREYVDARLDVARERWRLRAGYQGVPNGGTGIGGAQALDPAGRASRDRWNADLTYRNPEIAKGWDATVQASYLDLATRTDLVLFPPGAFGGAFPEGVIGNPHVFERHGRLDASAFYTGLRDHRIRLGTGVHYGNLYRVEESKNFVSGPSGFPLPLGSLVDVSATLPFLTPHRRTVAYAFAQDEWALAQRWDLTAGLRYDHYSDFGATVNPRAALVWQATDTLTAKAMYGRAFRAPSFQELYNVNNPTALGNRNLRPETIQTGELGLVWQPSSRVRTSVNLFRYEIRDLLGFVPTAPGSTTTVASNHGRQRGQGMELEGRWELFGVRVSGHYGYQRVLATADEPDAGTAPRHRGFLRVDGELVGAWQWNTQANWVAGRQRAPGDGRPGLANYVTVDATLRRRLGHGPWELAASVRNLFNADAREPASLLVPLDLPLPGRTAYLEARYGF